MEQSESEATVPSPAEPVPAEYDLLCESCGYSLIGLSDGNRCPECGSEFDPTALPLARVPWLYRKRLGGWQAYWLTVGKILRDPSGFAFEVCRPVRISVVDALLFRRRTIRRAMLTLIMPVVGLFTFAAGNAYFRFVAVNFADTSFVYLARGVVAASAIGVFSWILLTWGTDLPTFIWNGLSESPNELSPIQHYAAAPLALTPVLVIVVTAVGVLSSVFSRRYDPKFTIITFGFMSAMLLIYLWRTSAVLMRVATGCSRRRVVALLFYLPIHWLMISVLAFVGALMTAAFVRNVFGIFNDRI